MDATLPEDTLWDIVQGAETISHGNPSGVDTATTSGTRPVFFQKEQELQTLHLDMPAYLVIADSGITGNTKQAVRYVSTLQERIIDPTTQETGADAIQSIGAIVHETKEAIEEQDPQKLGQLMSETMNASNNSACRMTSSIHSSIRPIKTTHLGQKSQAVALADA